MRGARGRPAPLKGRIRASVLLLELASRLVQGGLNTLVGPGLTRFVALLLAGGAHRVYSKLLLGAYRNDIDNKLSICPRLENLH